MIIYLFRLNLKQDVNSDPKAIMDETNQFPYLMAIGEQKNDIKCYYIAIEKQIIPVKYE